MKNYTHLSKDVLLEIVFNLNVGIIIIDKDGFLVAANNSAEDMLGRSFGDMAGEEWSPVKYSPMQPNGIPYLLHELPSQIAIKTGKPSAIVVLKVLNPISNKYIWMRVSATPVADKSLVVINLENITSEMEFSNQLIKAKYTLSQAQAIANIGSFEYDVESQAVKWSDEEHRIYGLNPSESPPSFNELLEKYIYPGDVDLLSNRFLVAIQEASGFEIEHRIVRPNGEVRWVMQRASPQFDEYGALIGYIGTSEDITHRKNVYQTIQLHSEILSKITDGVYLVSATSFEIVFANTIIQSMFGYSEQELLGICPSVFNAPESGLDVSIAEKIINSILTNDHWEGNLQVQHKNGHLFWINAVVTCHYIAPWGKVWLNIVRDVTEQKVIQDALKESESLFRNLYEYSIDAILIGTPDGRILAANSQAQQMFRCSEAELCKGGRQKIVDVTDSRLESALAKRDSEWKFQGELTFIRHDGSKFPVEMTSSTFFDRDGNLKICIIIRDISDRIQMVADLADSREILALALSGAELGVWSLNFATGRVTFDERCWEMIGYTAMQIVPTREWWARSVHPDDLILVEEAVRRHKAGETRSCEVEYRIRHREGHWEWIQSRGKVTYDENDEPVRFTGIHQNITNRKRLVLEHNDLLRKMEALVDRVASMNNDDYKSSLNNNQNLQKRSNVRLSGRNREVLQLIAEGSTTAEIAAELNIAIGTAATHRRNLMRKLELKNKAELIRYAIKHNIIVP